MTTRRRGRPPHPDILTPREWQVLELIDEGLTNEQIGQRLGISADGAKFHVAQILAKLGVSSRHEAAPVAYANRGRRYRRWVFFPFLGKLGTGKTVNTVAAGGVVTAAAVALVALFFALRGQAGEPFDMYPGLYVLDVASGDVQRLVDLRRGAGRQVEWTKDGKGLLMLHHEDVMTADSERLRLFDAETGVVLQEHVPHPDYPDSFSLLPDGRIGAVIGEAGQRGATVVTAGILDPVTLKFEAIRRLEGADAGIESFWAPDANQVVVPAPLDTAAQEAFGRQYLLFDLRANGPPVTTRPRYWSPDGRRYAMQPDPLGSVTEVRDAVTNTLITTANAGVLTLSGPAPYIWSPDSRWLIAVSNDELVLVASEGSVPQQTIGRGSFYYTQNGGSGGPGWPTWSPDSTRIAFVDNDNVLQEVEIATGETRALYEAALIAEPRWSPDGRKIAFRIADTPSVYVARLNGQTDYVASGYLKGLSPRGDRIGLDFGANVYSVKPNGRSLTALSDLEPQYLAFFDRVSVCGFQRVQDSGWSPDGEWLIRSRINESDTDTNVMLRVPAGRRGLSEEITDNGKDFRWSPDGSAYAYIEASGVDCKVVLASRDNQVLATASGQTFEWVGKNHLLVTYNGSQVLLAPDGRTVQTFPSGAKVSPGLDVAFLSPVIPGTSRREATLINVATGEVVRSFDDGVYTGTFSPDGRYLILTYINGARMFELPSGSLVRTLGNSNNYLFSPDGRTLAFLASADVARPGNVPIPPLGAAANEKLYFLDLQIPSSTPQEVALSWGVIEMVWSPESTHLAFSASNDRTGQVPFNTGGIIPPSVTAGLNIIERTTLKQTKIADNASRVEWFPDGKRLVYQAD